MMWNFVEGEFWSKISIIPSGMDEDPTSNASSNWATSFSDLEGSCAKLASISILDNWYESNFLFTLSDFKLPKQESLTFDKLGTKERT